MVRTIDLPDLGVVDDASVFVADHAGTGSFRGSAIKTYIGSDFAMPADIATAMLGTIPVVTPQQHGAVGDGVADDTAAMQAAVTAALATTSLLYMPAGTYKITTSLSIGGMISIIGAGKTAAVLLLGVNNMTGISVTGALPVTISSLEITPASGITGTLGISIAPSGTPNSETILRDLQLLGLDRGVDTEAAENMTVDNVDFLNFVTYGLRVRNTITPDGGDSSISNCTFMCANATGQGIQQLSSGGLKISNTKVLAGLYGYQLALDAAVNTGDLLITGCSFEGQAGASISLGQSGSGGNFHSAEITGCQFNLTLQAVSVVNAFATPGWLLDLSISGGSMWINASGTAINLDGVTGFSISGVDFYSLGSSVTCINITNQCSSGVLAPMNYFGAGIIHYVVNAGSLVYVQPKIQRGAGSTATSTGYGTLFSGLSGFINYPVPYLGNTPKVFVTPNAIGAVGAISAYAVSVSLTQFEVQVVGNVTGQPVTYDWISYGDW